MMSRNFRLLRAAENPLVSERVVAAGATAGRSDGGRGGCHRELVCAERGHAPLSAIRDDAPRVLRHRIDALQDVYGGLVVTEVRHRPGHLTVLDEEDSVARETGDHDRLRL